MVALSEVLHPLHSRTAVETAMKTSMIVAVNDAIEQQPERKQQNIGQLVRDVVYNRCSDLSANTLIQLSFDQQFTSLFMIGSYVQKEWDKHYIFVVKDQHNQWFFGAPSELPEQWTSNTTEDVESALKTYALPNLYEVDNLQQLLRKISTTQPGSWPIWGDVERIIYEKAQYTRPKQTSLYSDKMNILTVKYTQETTKPVLYSVIIPPRLFPYLPKIGTIVPNANTHAYYYED